MPAATRERQDKVGMGLLDICLALHGHVKGSGDSLSDAQELEFVFILQDAVDNWEYPPPQPGQLWRAGFWFDMAVLHLIDATLREHREHVLVQKIIDSKEFDNVL
jgi:hypothetical protein